MTIADSDIMAWLREDDPQRLERLWQAAEQVRAQGVGDAVQLRGLIEISSHCVRDCRYCGLQRHNDALFRYRLSDEEVLECARLAVAFGYGTVVIQGGEDYGLSRDRVSGLIGMIKSETDLAITLSLGERPEADLAAWRKAGADRYLLRFESSNPQLYHRIHPDLGTQVSDRLQLLRLLKSLGYEVGSGVMVGIPGQTLDDLCQDILTFQELDLDMIGIGPYLEHPQTSLGQEAADIRAATVDQCPASLEMVYKAVALTRLLCPWANIPATTAVATVNTAQGREDALQRGANVVMPNLTPQQYRALYEIYPGKACITDAPEECHRCLLARLRAIGRHPGRGPGNALPRDAYATASIPTHPESVPCPP